MLNLIGKDYLFTKKIFLFSLLYCVVVPIFLMIDKDGSYYFADLLVPLALVTAPLAKILSAEDSKSGIIFQKSLPYSSFQKVGARFLFVLSLLLLSDILLCLMKGCIFKTCGLGEALTASVPIMVGFTIYFFLYLMIFYWKGYFASQLCIYVLIVVVCLGQKILSNEVVETVMKIMSNKVAVLFGTIGIGMLMYLLCCVFEKRKSLENK